MQDQPSLEQVLTTQITTWLKNLNIGDGAAEIHLLPSEHIDPEKGVLTQVFAVRVDRKMEKVVEDTKPNLLPPLPPVPGAPEEPS